MGIGHNKCVEQESYVHDINNLYLYRLLCLIGNYLVMFI